MEFTMEWQQERKKLEEICTRLPASCTEIALSLLQLCQQIEEMQASSVSLVLSASFPFDLHPRKCQCLAQSYSILLKKVLFSSMESASSSSSSSPSSSSSSESFSENLSLALTALHHAMLEGHRFLQDCIYTSEGQQLWSIENAGKAQQRWLIKKALGVALSTDILYVHLHDLVWCTLMVLIPLLDHDWQEVISLQVMRVHALLIDIWAQANEEDDVKSMQKFFAEIGAKATSRNVCYLTEFISLRLSEGTSNLTEDQVLPTYMWVDPKGFTRMGKVELGKGSFAKIFKTRWMGGMFASKEFTDTDDDDGVFSEGDVVYEKEALLHARLRHPNLVQLVCCAKRSSESRTGFLMELMHQNLHSLIKDRMKSSVDAPFSLLAGADLMLQIAKGMEYLHGLNIIHRDLKPDNILVSHPFKAPYLDQRGHVQLKIADFGESKVGLLFETRPKGTRLWRAPEVFDISPGDTHSMYTKEADVYSFAIICSEILTGLPPSRFFPRSLEELSKAVKNGRRPELPSSCPPTLSTFIKSCWHGDASKRPTFKQICTFLRYFKACILLRETKRLPLFLQDYMWGLWGVLRAEIERESRGMFHHLISTIAFDMHWLCSIMPLGEISMLGDDELNELLISDCQEDLAIAIERMVLKILSHLGNQIGTSIHQRILGRMKVLAHQLKMQNLLRQEVYNAMPQHMRNEPAGKGIASSTMALPRFFFLTHSLRKIRRLGILGLLRNVFRLELLCEHPTGPHHVGGQHGLSFTGPKELGSKFVCFSSHPRSKYDEECLRHFLYKLLLKHNCLTVAKIHDVFGVSRADSDSDFHSPWLCDEHRHVHNSGQV